MSCNSCKDKYTSLLPFSHCGRGADCGCKPCDCDSCDSGCGCPKCGCPQPIESIEALDSTNPALIRFNYGGRSVTYDFTNAMKHAETDTSMKASVASTADRALVYSAERHTDSISASELGSILHIADIGDVDITNLEDSSIFVYQKKSDCGAGCEGIDNSWIAWNAYDDNNLKTSLNSLMGFDEDGKPRSLATPTNTNQYYDIGWNAQDKISYSQPVEASTPPLDTDNRAYLVFIDPTTKQKLYVKVTVEDDGTIKVAS